MRSENREGGLFVPLMVGGVLLLAVGLLVFVLPIVPDPRPRKPMDGVPDRTTVWDKWTWERNVRRAIQNGQADNAQQKADAENLGTVHREP